MSAPVPIHAHVPIHAVFDRDQVEVHIKLLHERAAGVDGVLVLAAFDENGKPLISGFAVGAAEKMTDAIMAYEGRQVNVYVGLQVMRPDLERGKRGREEDIVALIGLVADFDHGSGEEGVAKMIADKLVPSYVIESSPGNAQAALIFDTPVTSRDVAKQLAEQFRKATPLSDDCAKDITHVFRVPGTLNFPNISKIKAGRSPIPAPSE